MLSFYINLLDDDNDKSKFEEYYGLYRQDMYRIAYSILHNCEDSEDAVHEAFVRIAKNFSKISQIKSSKVLSYFVIIVRNISIDMIRSKKRRNTVSIDDENIVVPSIDDVAEQMDYTHLLDILKALPPIHREVLLLCARGHKTAEIAEILGISYKAASQRINRARALFHEQITEDNNERHE